MKQGLCVLIGLLLGLIGINSNALARTYALPTPGNDVVGEAYTAYARDAETLADVGRRHGIGFYQMVYANPRIAPRKRLGSSSKVFIPAKFILPPVARKGVVINLAEMRMYFYPPDSNVVMTFPIGIGRENGWETPTGETVVTAKEANPIWRPTARVRAEAARNGYPIPEVFPPGPDNPLGKYAIRLGWPTYLIHGTNQVNSIGGRVSAGCIRMLPNAIAELFAEIPIGIKVTVINQPFKAGWSYGQLYFEAHEPLQEDKMRYRYDKTVVVRTIHERLGGRSIPVRWSVVSNIAYQHSGVPTVVSN